MSPFVRKSFGGDGGPLFSPLHPIGGEGVFDIRGGELFPPDAPWTSDPSPCAAAFALKFN